MQLNNTYHYIHLVLSLILLVKFSHVINKYKLYSTAVEYHSCCRAISLLYRGNHKAQEAGTVKHSWWCYLQAGFFLTPKCLEFLEIFNILNFPKLSTFSSFQNFSNFQIFQICQYFKMFLNIRNIHNFTENFKMFNFFLTFCNFSEFSKSDIGDICFDK